jgi:transcription elongation factor GreA
MDVLARVRQMPDEIMNPMRKAITERFPDLQPKDELPFWHSNRIYCSREGIEKRSAEYTELIHVKIPENSADIGRAAAYGDLSENYEWTAAIEQQRQLTEKAAAMEAELRQARLIEDEKVVEGVVQPGTRVTFERAGNAATITILGPWDSAEGVVSYKAPMASGMLGAKAGETATLDLPEGTVQVLIKHVEAAL